MRSGRRSWTIALLGVVWFSSFGLVAAGEPTEAIRRTTERVIQIFEDPQLQAPDKRTQRHELLRQVSDEAFDWEEMARRALARHWRERTPQQQQEFIGLFRDLVERTYMNRLEQAAQEKQAVYYTDEQVDSSRAVVKTKVVTKSNQELLLEYRLHKPERHWRIYDVLVEGVSLVNNYRSQFNRILASSPYTELIQRMRAKQAEEAPAEPDRKTR